MAEHTSVVYENGLRLNAAMTRTQYIVNHAIELTILNSLVSTRLEHYSRGKIRITWVWFLHYGANCQKFRTVDNLANRRLLDIFYILAKSSAFCNVLSTVLFCKAMKFLLFLFCFT